MIRESAEERVPTEGVSAYCELEGIRESPPTIVQGQQGEVVTSMVDFTEF